MHAIKQLADAVNAQQAESAWQHLQCEDNAVMLLDQPLIGYIVIQ